MSNEVVVATTNPYKLKNSESSQNGYSSYVHQKGKISNYSVYHRYGSSGNSCNSGNGNSNGRNSSRYNRSGVRVNNYYRQGRTNGNSQNRGQGGSGGNGNCGFLNKSKETYNYYNHTFGIYSGQVPSTIQNNNSTNKTFSNTKSITTDNKFYDNSTVSQSYSSFN